MTLEHEVSTGPSADYQPDTNGSSVSELPGREARPRLTSLLAEALQSRLSP